MGDFPLKATFKDSEMRSIDLASLTKSNSNSICKWRNRLLSVINHTSVEISQSIHKRRTSNQSKGEKKKQPDLRVHREWRLNQIVHRIVVRSWQKLFDSGCRSSSTHVLQGVAPIHHAQKPE